MSLQVIEGGDAVVAHVRTLREQVDELEADPTITRRREILADMADDSFYGGLVAASLLSDEMADAVMDLLARLVAAPDCRTKGEAVRKLVLTAFREAVRSDSRPGAMLQEVLPVEIAKLLPITVRILHVPGWYEVGENGTWLGAPGSGASKIVAPVPFIVAGRTVDATTEKQYLTLMWWDPAIQKWRRVQTPREIALTATRIVSLAGQGLPVSSVTSRNVVAYISAFEAANTAALPSVQVTSRLGWWPLDAGDTKDFRAFVLPDAVIGEPGSVTFQAPENADDIVRHVRRKGTWQGWLDMVGSFAEYPLLFASLYAVAASVLLPFTGCPNFTLHFADETSVGKTTAMLFGASAVGKPTETDGYLGSWATKQVWRERTAGVLGSLPFFLDELKRARNVDEAVQFVYDHWQGIGVGRGTPTSVQARCSWRSVLLSTGEGPITEATISSRSQHGGLAGRVLELRGRPMGPDSQHNGEQAKRLRREVQENYGHLVPVMVGRLFDVRESWGYLADLHRQAAEEYSRWPGVNDQSIGGRLAEYLAQLDVASYFLHEVLGVPAPVADPLPAIADSALGMAAKESRAVRMVYRLREWLSSNEASFFERARTHEGQPVVPYYGWAGSWPKGDWTHILLLKHALERLIASWGVAPVEVTEMWVTRGYIDGTRTKPTRLVDLAGIGIAVPCYAIRREVIEGPI